MIRDLTLTEQDGTVTSLYPDRLRPNYRIVKSTWDMEGMSRITRNKVPLLQSKDRPNPIKGLPDTWHISEENPNGQPGSVILNAVRQHYLLYINFCATVGAAWTKEEYFYFIENHPDTFANMARELTSALTDDRSHTNFHGLNNERNYLLDINREEADPLFAKLITGHARIRLKNDVETLRNVPGSGLCIAFECIDASKDYWIYNPIDHPYLFDQPLLTGRDVILTKGGPVIVRDDLHYAYGQFDNRLVFPMWLPRTDTAWIPVAQTMPMYASDPAMKFS